MQKNSICKLPTGKEHNIEYLQGSKYLSANCVNRERVLETEVQSIVSLAYICYMQSNTSISSNTLYIYINPFASRLKWFLGHDANTMQTYCLTSATVIEEGNFISGHRQWKVVVHHIHFNHVVHTEVVQSQRLIACGWFDAFASKRMQCSPI